MPQEMIYHQQVFYQIVSWYASFYNMQTLSNYNTFMYIAHTFLSVVVFLLDFDVTTSLLSLLINNHAVHALVLFH